MAEPLRILIVEDLPADAELAEREIKATLPESTFLRVETEDSFSAALDTFKPDLIICDYKLPRFTGMEALEIAQKKVPETPFIIFTGSINEAVAVECMKAGAWDYVLKDHIKRLGPALISALEQKKIREEKRLAEKEMVRAALEWQKTFDAVNSIIWLLSEDNRILRSNRIAGKFFHIPLSHIIGKKCFEVTHCSMSPIPECPVEKTKKTLKRESAEMQLDNRWFQITVDPIVENGTYKGVVHIMTDITDHKLAEKALIESEKKYRDLFENSVEGIFQSTPDGRYINLNPAIAKMHGYSSPKEMMREITDIGKQLYVHSEDRDRWKKFIKEKGVVKNFEVQQYRKDGSIFWVSLSARAVRDEKGNILYYEGTAEDITYRKEAEERLRKSLIGTINALSATVEARDPYTAGHQKRVSTLARSIAQEMGLPRETIDIIRMAGTIHDIGKIAVPAEILSKPTRLTPLEMDLLKTHSEAGYEILKDTGLPYPIAEMVYQHHERLNGSGYPRGLKGSEILLESCILAVADVVEAMSSHRPYRPALGIDATLKEIEENKGILYHPEVVDACLKLFKEKGFRLE